MKVGRDSCAQYKMKRLIQRDRNNIKTAIKTQSSNNKQTIILIILKNHPKPSNAPSTYTSLTQFIFFSHLTHLNALQFASHHQQMSLTLTSTLSLASNTPLEKQQLRKMRTILQMLMDNSDSAEFRTSVDWQGLGLTDYPQIIKQPMDLGTVFAKLQSDRYRWVEEMLDDIQLIWDNCKIYNHEGSWIYLLADKMDKFYKKLIKNYFTSVQFAPLNNSKPAPEKDRQRDKERQRERQRERERQRQKQRERERQREREAQKERERQRESASLPQRSSRAAARKIERSKAIEWDSSQERQRYQERTKLADLFKRLNSDNLGKVVELILHDSPSACQYLEETRCQISLDRVQPWICQQLREYMMQYSKNGGRDVGGSGEIRQKSQKRGSMIHYQRYRLLWDESQVKRFF